ncbi:galactose-binding domain-like protein [Infundibulicybe gibba]|nr:galactose-binding domain-like protein [Infundibulicybe gibba]
MLLAIVVPLTYNDPGEGRNFINGTDAVDLYSLDPYPQGFDCSSSTVWRPVNTSYHSYHASVNPSQAWYFPEFQGGSFDAWGPTAPGYPPCRVLTGPDFQSVFDRQLWASNAKLINYYMIYGGTSWGVIPFHGVYILLYVYDYGASITESRELTTKFDELKRQESSCAAPLNSTKQTGLQIPRRDWLYRRPQPRLSPSSRTPTLRPDSNIVRQTDSTSTFRHDKLQMNEIQGYRDELRIWFLAAGIFDSTSILAGTIDGRDVHFLYGDSSQAHESELPLTVTPNPLTHAQSSVKFTAGLTTGTAIVSFESGIEGLVTAWDSDKQLVLFADSVTAATFWSPVAGKAADLKDSLPEVTSGFSNASWAVANHMTTNIPPKPYCENIVLWRGHFEATGNEKNVNLSINRGEAFAASVWANNVFLGTSFGNSTNNRNILEETDDKFTFPAGSLKAGKDNVITIVQDNMGLNETNGANPDTSKSPRGVREFKLDTGSFGAWKVQGKVGGYTGFPDKVRGVFNENGLFGERKGWHLPGFNTLSWATRDLATGLPGSAAGVFDVPMSFTFEEPFGQPYRAILFVNGWMMGKGVGNLGPQAKFPMHEGILDYRGEK